MRFSLKFYLLIVFILVTSCTHEDISSGVNLLTPEVATDIATPANSSKDSINSVIIQHCPDQRKVPLQELNLDETNQLLFNSFIPNEDGIWIISGSDQQAKLISNTVAEQDYAFSYKDISLDGEWLLFRQYSYDRAPEDRGTVWIVSIDGSVRKQLLSLSFEQNFLVVKDEGSLSEWKIENTNGVVNIYWSAPNEITIDSKFWNASGNAPTYPVFVIDILDEAKGRLLDIEKVVEFMPLGSDYVQEEVSHQVFASWRDSDFYLFDENHNKTIPIFQWLKNETWINWDAATLLGFIYWQDMNDLGYMAIVQPYGLDLATRMDYQTVTEETNYNSIMQELIIPPGQGHLGEYRMPNLIPVWVSQDGYKLGIFSKIGNDEAQFYVFDSRDNTLHDYCTLPITDIFSAKGAPNGNFVGWAQGQDTIILDLETGRFAQLLNLTLLDWVEVSE